MFVFIVNQLPITDLSQVTHTNDLTALALTHSALHDLAIPHIYSRFDIVWPDAHTTSDPRTGVDALTYGLATLCMGDVFTDHSQIQHITCTNCGARNTTECSHGLDSGSAGQRRLGNQYPQFTRKFSLGNGPEDWVQEYLITKESGKMLGTLVALVRSLGQISLSNYECLKSNARCSLSSSLPAMEYND